jgi:V8-like Glu-specific endopeptidase
VFETQAVGENNHMKARVFVANLPRLIMWFTLLLLPASLPCLAADTSIQLPQIARFRLPVGAAIIFGTDNRTHVADTTKFPWSAIGEVVSDYGFELHIGTGAMIGNKTVLTAAHVIYDEVLGWPNSIMFIPGRNDSFMPFGEVMAADRVVPNQWIRGNGDYDIGLVVLDRDVGQQTGFLQLAIKPDSFFTSQALESAGYPSDRGSGDAMYSVTGPSFGVDGKMILERITTEDGQSGSPVWFMSGGAPAVVGVIVGWQEITPSQGPVINQGLSTRIDYEFGTLINSTLYQHGDVTQPNLPAFTPGTPDPTPVSTPVFRCGAGAGQALLVVSLTWTLCIIPRRVRRCRP